MSVKEEKKPFEYFDSPDGEDILPKMQLLFKPVAITSFMLSTMDVMLYSHPKGYMQTLGRYIHVSWPVFGATGAFVLGSNLAGSIRKKDDKLNWFIGGAAAGSVVGLWGKSGQVGLLLAIGFGFLALGKKHCQEQNKFFLVPNNVRPQWGFFGPKYADFTLTKDRPGNWTTGGKS